MWTSDQRQLWWTRGTNVNGSNQPMTGHTNPLSNMPGLCLIWAEITRISEATPALRRTQRLYSKQIRRRERIFQTILLWGIELSERGDRTQQIPRWQKNSLRRLKCADNDPWNIARDTLHRDQAIRGEKGSGLFWKDSWEAAVTRTLDTVKVNLRQWQWSAGDLRITHTLVKFYTRLLEAVNRGVKLRTFKTNPDNPRVKGVIAGFYSAVMRLRVSDYWVNTWLALMASSNKL